MLKINHFYAKMKFIPLNQDKKDKNFMQFCESVKIQFFFFLISRNTVPIFLLVDKNTKLIDVIPFS